jgi:hypothetical protein
MQVTGEEGHSTCLLFSRSVRTFACATRSRDSNVAIARACRTSNSTAIPSSHRRKKTTWLSRNVSLGTDNLDNPIAAQPTISRQKTCHATLDQGSTRSYRSNPVPGQVLDCYRVTSKVPEAIQCTMQAFNHISAKIQVRQTSNTHRAATVANAKQNLASCDQ